jgi:CO/xanthine dehydrogenase Mo-binding subunit
MDEMADRLNMDPLKLIRKNHIQSGEGSPIFEALGEGTEGTAMVIQSCELEACITKGAREIGWRKKQRRYREGTFPPTKETMERDRLFRGVGVSCHMQGSSIPYIDMAAASLKINDDGSFNLLVGATDIGTGSDTVLAQIAAETLGTDLGQIIVYSSDTDYTPFDVGAYASSTTYLSGEAVRKCALKVKDQVLEVACRMMSLSEKEIEKLQCSKGKVSHAKSRKEVSFADVALNSLYQDKQFQIGAMASSISHQSPPPFAAHFAEVEVDTWTGMVKVLNYVAAVDCGTAINPIMAEGQTEGAVLNGISYALTEEYIFDKAGRMMNPGFDYYKIFGTQDVPEIKTILVSSYEPTGPYGAKSVSEISINGPMPAISNAIYDAVGIRLHHAPFTPEKVLAAVKDKD